MKNNNIIKDSEFSKYRFFCKKLLFQMVEEDGQKNGTTYGKLKNDLINGFGDEQLIINELNVNNRGYDRIGGDFLPRIYWLKNRKLFELATPNFFLFVNEFRKMASINKNLNILEKNSVEIINEFRKHLITEKIIGDTAFNDFIYLLQKEFFYVGNLKRGLRFDFMRNLNDDGTFEGGFLHIAKHFSFNNNKNNAPAFVTSLYINTMINTFFFSKKYKSPKGKSLTGYGIYNHIKVNRLFFVFYISKTAPNLFLLNSCHKENK